MWAYGGRRYLVLLSISIVLAVAAETEASTSISPSSLRPKLFSLFDSGDGLILICIGVNETSNLTWYWRRDGSDLIVPIPSNEDVRTHESKYWMIFRNELKSTSRLEVHGLSPEYNNTDFICKSHGFHEEYPFVSRNSTKKNDGKIGHPLLVTTVSVPTANLSSPRHEQEQLFQQTTPSHNVTTTHHRHGIFPQIYSPHRRTYVGDYLLLECTYTLRESPVKWNLEFPGNRRDVYLSVVDVEISSNEKVYFSHTKIMKLWVEHNNSKVICENEEGRSEYIIRLGQKKRLQEQCTQPVDCLDPNALCRHGFCSCKPSFVSHGKLCLETKKYRERCQSTDQCKDTDKFMWCSHRGRCSCLLGYFYDGLRCQAKKSVLGDICYVNDNCAFAYGTCRNVSATSKECTCQDGFSPEGIRCISRHRQNEEHLFRVGFLTATIVIVILFVTLIIFVLKSARHCYMHRKRNHYKEVIMGEHQLSISSRLAKHPSSRADVVTQHKIDTPCGPMEMTFTNIRLTPPQERREAKKMGEDKTVCVPETIPFINMESSSNC